MGKKVIIRMKKNKIVATVGRKTVAAMIFGQPDDASKKRNINIFELDVLPEFRRQGIATAMLKFFLKKFTNVTWISFWTGKKLEIDKGFKLYTALGFKEIAYQADYYEKGVGTRLYVKRVK